MKIYSFDSNTGEIINRLSKKGTIHFASEEKPPTIDICINDFPDKGIAIEIEITPEKILSLLRPSNQQIRTEIKKLKKLKIL